MRSDFNPAVPVWQSATDATSVAVAAGGPWVVIPGCVLTVGVITGTVLVTGSGRFTPDSSGWGGCTIGVRVDGGSWLTVANDEVYYYTTPSDLMLLTLAPGPHIIELGATCTDRAMHVRGDIVVSRLTTQTM